MAKPPIENILQKDRFRPIHVIEREKIRTEINSDQAAAERALMERFGVSDFQELVRRLKEKPIKVEKGPGSYIQMKICGYSAKDGCFLLLDEKNRVVTYKIFAPALKNSFDEITIAS